MNARDLVQRETGLDLTEAVVERAVAERVAALGMRDSARYLASLNPAELQALTELLVVPESWMFRDPEAFAAAARIVCAKLAAQPGRLVRILSIPCAGGEEPYSMAMALKDAGVARGAVRIDAIDLSEVALARARRGLYTRNAFRGGDQAFRERHFTQIGNEYQIDDALRGEVSFNQGNLLTIDTNTNAGRYDIVFCRNLLIYFNDSTAAGAIARLRLMLADEGTLFAGYAEVPAFCANGFTPVRTPGAFALQKERRRVARTEEPVLTARTRAPLPTAVRRPPAVDAPSPAPAPARPIVAKPAPADLLARAGKLADGGELAEAAALCHQALALDPGAAEAYFILGMISECERKPGVADGYWRRCIYLQPDHYQALCHLALLAEQQGEAAQAAAFRQRAARVFGRRGGAARSLS